MSSRLRVPTYMLTYMLVTDFHFQALADVENIKSELQQQLKLRQRAEQGLQATEEELNKLKTQQAAPAKDTVSVGLKQEIERLAQEG